VVERHQRRGQPVLLDTTECSYQRVTCYTPNPDTPYNPGFATCIDPTWFTPPQGLFQKDA